MLRAAKSMPKSPAITPGDDVEIRVAQAWFWEGHFARRGINLKRHYQADAIEVTDLDLLAIEITPTLQPRKYIGESKSGRATSAAKPLDRIIWLRGLMDLLRDVAGAELTTVRRPPATLVDLASPLNVLFQSFDDLERREARLRMDHLADAGSQGPGAFLMVKKVQAAAKEDPELDRAYWLLRSDVWFLEPWMAIKRLLAAIEAVSKQWSPKLADESQEAVTWLLAESVSVFTLYLCMAAAPALRLSPSEYGAFVANHLADAGVDPRRMQQLSDAIDRYVAGLLGQFKAPRTVVLNSMGAFAPTPPQYADALAETARRISARVDIARSLPRYVDLIAHERLVRQRDPDVRLVLELDGANPVMLARATRIVAAFLVGHASLPQTIADLLGRPASPARFEPAIPSALSTAQPTTAGRPDQNSNNAEPVSAPVSQGPGDEAAHSAWPHPDGQVPGVPISLFDMPPTSLAQQEDSGEGLWGTGRPAEEQMAASTNAEEVSEEPGQPER